MQTRLREDTIEVALGGKYGEMVEFLCCVYPDILANVTGLVENWHFIPPPPSPFPPKEKIEINEIDLHK